MDERGKRRLEEHTSGEAGTPTTKRAKDGGSSSARSGSSSMSGNPQQQSRRVMPSPVVVKTEQSKAQSKGTKISMGEIQKVKAAALREAEKTTGHYIGFDSPHGNYLLPALPSLSSPSAAATSGGPAAKSSNSEPSTPVSPRT